MSGMREEAKRWETTTVKTALDKFPERKELFASTSGI